MKRHSIYFLSLCAIFVSQAAGAESLSDLNMKQFQDRLAPPVKSSENPFIRQNVTPQDLLVEDLNLTGIIYQPKDAFALISGFIVKDGDDIAGYKVKLIEKDRVILRQLDQVKVLRLE